MKTTIPKLRKIVRKVILEQMSGGLQDNSPGSYYDQEEEDRRDMHRGYKEGDGEQKIYDPSFGWVTEEELAELEAQM